jgi:hypothetical protein
MNGGVGKRNMHNRKTSVLTKGLQISRHERGRSRVPNLQIATTTTTENGTTTLENLDVSP